MTNLKLTLITISALIVFILLSFNSNAQLHVIKPNGDVGIGTSAPTQKLDVNGNIVASGGSISATGGYVSIKPNDNNAKGKCSILLFGENNGKVSAEFISNGLSGSPGSPRVTTSSFQHHGDGVFNLRTWDPSSFIQFITTAENELPILAFTIKGKNGFVGIKQQNPTAELEVNGTAKKSGGGEWSTTSDKRTKKNINSYTAGLADVLKLNPVTFNYNGKAGISDTEKSHVGLIAQEFAEIAPYAVDKFNFKEEGSNKTEEYMSLDASSVKYMLVNAIKEQQAKIESLEERLAKVAQNSSPVSTPGATEISVLLEGTGTENALLAQNTPNPFTTKTRIEYFIPTNSRNARMSFRDMTGKEIKRVELTNDGIGAIELSAKDLAAGIYSYVLYVNGSIVSSKKMVLKQ